MFNNPFGSGGNENDSGSLWIKMLGVRPVLEAGKNPATIQPALDMMRAVIESQMATARVEAKLDVLLRAESIDVDAINKRVAERFTNGGPVVTVNGNRGGWTDGGPVVPEQQRTDGAGGHPAAGGAADHGSEAAARSGRGTGGRRGH